MKLLNKVVFIIWTWELFVKCVQIWKYILSRASRCNIYFFSSWFPAAKENVIWKLWQSEEEKAGRERGVRLPDGCGDAKGSKLPERLWAPNLRRRPGQAWTGELVLKTFFGFYVIWLRTAQYLITVFKSRVICTSIGWWLEHIDWVNVVSLFLGFSGSGFIKSSVFLHRWRTLREQWDRLELSLKEFKTSQ